MKYKDKPRVRTGVFVSFILRFVYIKYTRKYFLVEVDSEEDDEESAFANTALRRQMDKLTVPKYEKCADGNRNYAKVDYCLFCERCFRSKISVHYIGVHTDEEVVRKALKHPIGSMARKRSLLLLQNRGNFMHNSKVIEAGEGELIVARRPGADFLFTQCNIATATKLHRLLEGVLPLVLTDCYV